MHLTYKRSVSDVREERSKREGQGNVGKVDEYERGQALQAKGIKNVTAIERVAAKGVLNKTSEWPGERKIHGVSVCVCVWVWRDKIHVA